MINNTLHYFHSTIQNDSCCSSISTVRKYDSDVQSHAQRHQLQRNKRQQLLEHDQHKRKLLMYMNNTL